MLHFAHLILNYVTLHWVAISSLIGGGATLSVVLQYVLHKLHIDSKKLAYTLIHVLSIVSALAAYYVDNKSVLPAYAGMAIVAQTVHRFAVSPYYNKYVLPYLTFLSEGGTPIGQSLAAPAASRVAPLEQAPAFVS